MDKCPYCKNKVGNEKICPTCKALLPIIKQPKNKEEK